jgi:hypothetical protein
VVERSPGAVRLRYLPGRTNTTAATLVPASLRARAPTVIG